MILAEHLQEANFTVAGLLRFLIFQNGKVDGLSCVFSFLRCNFYCIWGVRLLLSEPRPSSFLSSSFLWIS